MTIYCAMPFFNEIDLLKLKLEELDNIVDYFIVSESNYTHSGKNKSYYFLNYISTNDYFWKFIKKGKILHQLIYDTPSDYTNLKYTNNHQYNFLIDRLNKQNHWPKNVESYGRDTWEKESLIRILLRKKLDDSDIIILGDCDEIPKANKLKEIISHFDSNQIYHMQHDFYWYYMNILKTDEKWYGNIVCSFKTFKEKSFCEMRQNKQGIFIDNAGWHFSYMGGINQIKQKIESWGEQSLNQDWVKNNIEENVKDCLINNRDLFFRRAKFEKVDITYESHPKYLVDHLKDYKEFILE